MIDIEDKILRNADVSSEKGLMNVLKSIDNEIQNVEALERELHLQYIQMQPKHKDIRIVGGDHYDELQRDILRAWEIRMRLFSLKDKYQAELYRKQVIHTR